MKLCFYIVWGSLSFISVDLFARSSGCEWHEPLLNVSSIFCDLKRFGHNIVSSDMVGVITPFIPPFALSYMADGCVRNKFYCRRHHKNIRASSTTLLDFSECLVGLSIGTLCSCSFAVRHRRLQRTAQLYAITLPFTWALKSILKKIPWCGNIRPKSEHFCRHKTYYGGFPSGHMLEMAYATVLFGLSMGPGFAIPLAFSTGVVATAFVKHRHTIPQLIAGAALGTVFGVAGYWAVIQSEEPEQSQWCISPKIGGGEVAVCAEYRF